MLGLRITEQNGRWRVLAAMTVAMLPLSIGGFEYVVTLPAWIEIGGNQSPVGFMWSGILRFARSSRARA